MNGSSQRFDRSLDVTGTLCPVPVVEARRALAEMAAGQVLEVLADDPLAELDLKVMCQHTGHALLEGHADPDGRVRALIRCQPSASTRR